MHKPFNFVLPPRAHTLSCTQAARVQPLSMQTVCVCVHVPLSFAQVGMDLALEVRLGSGEHAKD